MKHLFLLLLFLLPAIPGAAKGEVPFVSGALYAIRCLQWPEGCVVQNPAVPEALRYEMDAEKNPELWRITRQINGTYLLQHERSGLYAVYDGRRTDDRRYMRLAKLENSDSGSMPDWDIKTGQAGLLIFSHGKSDHYWDVREYGKNIVGTYSIRMQTRYNSRGVTILPDNERFFLTNEKGKRVTSFDGEAVKFLAVPKGAKASSRGVTARRGAKPSPSPGTMTFTIDGRRASYCRQAKSYLFSIPEKNLESYTGSIETTATGTLYVDGKSLKGGRFTVKRPTRKGHSIHLALVKGSDTVATANVAFTILPIVELEAPNGFNHKNYVEGTFTFLSPSNPKAATPSAARLRYRGESAMFFNKKSYAVKLRDAGNKKRSDSFCGLRSDNYWILDAMAVDHARMRNRVAQDLWNDFARRPAALAGKRNAFTATRGNMVEVFVGGKYRGLYCLNERLDRKQLDLKRPLQDGTPVGCLYKTRNWGNWANMGYDRYANRLLDYVTPDFNNQAPEWQEWESVYPEPDANTQTNWEPLAAALSFVATASNKNFVKYVGKYFDMPSVIDYWLFIELLHAVDNTGKNMYWACFDARSQDPQLTPCPWDLDGSFGRMWDGHRGNVLPTNNYRDYLRRNQLQNGLFERLTTTPEFREQIVKRYRELRRTHFSFASLKARFDKYFDLLEATGALRRERNYHHNANGIYLTFPEERAFIEDWLEKRLLTMDEAYN